LRVCGGNCGNKRGEGEKNGEYGGPAAAHPQPQWEAFPGGPGGHDQTGAGAAAAVCDAAITPPPRTRSPS
jgi:hypothetical protein